MAESCGHRLQDANRLVNYFRPNTVSEQDGYRDKHVEPKSPTGEFCGSLFGQMEAIVCEILAQVKIKWFRRNYSGLIATRPKDSLPGQEGAR
jgi:hypothetical protein